MKSVPAGGESNILFKGDSGQSLGYLATRNIGICIEQGFPASQSA